MKQMIPNFTYRAYPSILREADYYLLVYVTHHSTDVLVKSTLKSAHSGLVHQTFTYHRVL